MRTITILSKPSSSNSKYNFIQLHTNSSSYNLTCTFTFTFTQITAKYLEEREKGVDHHNAVTEKRRAENLKMEEERWDAIEKREQGEINRQHRLQADP